MTTRQNGAIGRQLNALFNLGATRELTDGHLLEQFCTGRGESSELAFEALVERHGAMVLRVCRAELVDPHDSQDAFQATFLILVEKAHTLWVRDSLGPWLHEVAFRTASCARSNTARRRRDERRAAEVVASLHAHTDRTESEMENLLHEEINRLPECYRVPIVLCELEGCTCEEAARRMGHPVGTVKSWRYRGRERLRGRLIRRGLAPSVGLGGSLALDVARAAAPEVAVRIAARAFRDSMAAGEATAPVRTLVKGVLRIMLFGKLRMAATAVIALAFVTAGLGVVARDSNRAIAQAPSSDGRPTLVEQTQPVAPSVNDPGESWPLSLHDAIVIGLDRSNAIRLIFSGGRGTPSKIAPLKLIDPQQFKAEAMAKVRSIEHQYWNLGQAHVQLRASQEARKLAEGMLKRDQADRLADHADAAVIADASLRLEQIKTDLKSKTSDLIATERLLRKVLGLPLDDGRHIVPITEPTETRLDPDWEQSLAIMLVKQPDVVQARVQVQEAKLSFSGGDRSARVERTKANLQQVIHKTTHSLARFFLELDANDKQLRIAANVRAKAKARLELERGNNVAGRSTVDRYLDAVNHFGAAVATEAQHKAAYNNSIVALEEAKGTLLEYNQIAVVEVPGLATATAAEQGPAANLTPGEPSVPDPTTPTAPDSLSPRDPRPFPPVSLPDTDAPSAEDRSPQAGSRGKTFSFQVTVSVGAKPVEIRGSFTVTPAQPVDLPR